MSWTDEKVEKLRELWKKGHTASQIAEVLGDTTRNAVIGKAHRLDLEERAPSKNKSSSEKKDPTKSTEEALLKVYYLLRGSDAPSPESAQKFIDRMFFSPKKYDLGEVGRYRLDKQFNVDNKGKDPVLTRDDFLITIKYLILMIILI